MIVNMDQHTWNPMPDRGSVTENHYDHVHVSIEPIIEKGGWELIEFRFFCVSSFRIKGINMRK